MHRFYSVNTHRYFVCLCKIYAVKKFVSFSWNFSGISSCVIQINRIPFISLKTSKKKVKKGKIKEKIYNELTCVYI